MREIKPVNGNVPQKKFVEIMASKIAGTYGVGQVHNIMKSIGLNMSESSVRRHLGYLAEESQQK